MAPSSARQYWLDWQRGLAVLFMIEWHTYDAWIAPSAATGTLDGIAKFVGGLAAPSFLFMAGLSQVLADSAMAKKGVAAGARRVHALRRALWLLGVAYLFRGAEYVLGGGFLKADGWQSILRVDVLNIIAVSLLLSALFSAGVPARLQAVLAILATAGIAALTPVVAGWEHEPSRILDYLFGTHPRAIFYLCPWAAFVFAGSAVGRLALWGKQPPIFLGLGAALFFGGYAADFLPPVFDYQNFWVTSPSWLFMRIGMVVFIGGLLQLLPDRADRGLSWLRTLGRHSLLGYMLSVELPYGVLSHPLHDRLPMAAAIVAVVGMIALIWAASWGKDRWDARKAGKPAAPPATPAAT